MSAVDTASGVLAIVGASFVLLAGIGIVRFPNLLARMHAATKAPTFGLVLCALGAAIAMEDGRAKLVITVAMIIVTVPVAGHLVARASYRGPGGGIGVDADDELRSALDAGDGDHGDD